MPPTIVENLSVPLQTRYVSVEHGETANNEIIRAQYDDTGYKYVASKIVDSTGSEWLLEANGGMPVNIQDQTSKPIDALFAKSVSNFTLATDTVASTITNIVYTFTASTGHGINNPVGGVNDEILLLDVLNDKSFYAEVLDVTGDVITVDRPIDHVYPSGGVVPTLGRIVITNMAVDGSTTPQVFSLRAGVNPIDFVRFIVTMTDNSSMDDNRFGGLSKLTRGLTMRIVDGFQKTIFNWKTNGEIAQWCFDTTYSDKAPSGYFGFRARVTFGGQSKHGVVLRISTGDVIQIVVQDNLEDLETLRICGEGHEVTD